MGICGYNQKIGAGLNLLFEGMMISMDQKEIDVGSLQALEDEIFELEVMIDKMKDKGTIQDMFVGLDILALYMFKRVKDEIILSPSKTIRSVMEILCPAFVNTIKEAEELRDSFQNKSRSDIYKISEWVVDNINYPNKLPNLDVIDRIEVI